VIKFKKKRLKSPKVENCTKTYGTHSWTDPLSERKYKNGGINSATKFEGRRCVKISAYSDENYRRRSILKMRTDMQTE